MMETRRREDAGIGAMPLVVIALLLIVPVLNVEFTFYRMTLKLFAFQTAVTVLWCGLALRWAAGRERPAAWPAWWLFAPLAGWVAWGAATMLWSPQPGLAGNWVVGGLTGWLGALGLAVLLADRAARHMFVKGASAVAFVLALWMFVAYEGPTAAFFGDRDLVGPPVGMAFLLLPTLVAAAALYGVGRGEAERNYQGVLWMVLLLLALLGAGLRARVPAWWFALGVGVAMLVWLLLPRWRVLAPLLVAFVVVAAMRAEVRRAELVRGEFVDTPASRQAYLDRADWGLWAAGSLGQKVAGRGVGTYFVAYDLARPLETYAVRFGDGLVDHARRQLVEVLCERGLVGLGLALAAGAACGAAGAVCLRRARHPLDAASAAGVACGVVALGVFAGFSNGAIGFGAAVGAWLGVGLLGALSAVHGRPAGLALSVAEERWRAERAPRRGRARKAVAGALCVAAVAVWFGLGARPFWAELHLCDGLEEHKALQALIAQYKQLIARRDAFSPNERKYLKARRAARRRQGAAREVAELRKELPPRVIERLEAFLESVQAGRDGLLRSAARTEEQFRKAAALSLGDRVWLTAQVNRLRYAIDRSRLDGRTRDLALELGRRLHAWCGPFFTLDLERARFLTALRRYERAHQLFRRYARKNPFAVSSALRRSTVDLYGDWAWLIVKRHEAGDRRAGAWAEDFLAAARRGFRFDPTRYALLAWRGRLLYQLGRVEEAYVHMQRALDLIEAELARPHAPRVQADLLLDAAILTLPWDPERAAGFTEMLGLLGLPLTDPEYRPVVARAMAIRDRIGLPRALPAPPVMRSPGPRPARAKEGS